MRQGRTMAVPGRQVLVVDDDADIRNIVGGFLSDEGYQTRTAVDGGEALEILGSWQPSVILLDLIDGWTFLACQQADPKLADVPVIVMSATYTLNRPTTMLSQATMLPKPFEIEQLLSLVEGLTR
jgi:CheY-like chemotaxis protein